MVVRLNKNQPPQSLKSLVHRNFLTSSLIPIFTIEVILLILYFGVNTYIASRRTAMLLQQAKEDIGHLAGNQSRIIDLQLKQISQDALMLQEEIQRFFANQDRFPIPGSDPQFAFAENGVFYKTNKNGGSSLYYSTLTRITEKERRKAFKTEAFDPLFKFVKENNPNVVAVYFNSFDSMSRYYPFIDEVYGQFERDTNIPKFNFYYLADFAHNPQRKAVWTGVYLDPAGQGWMVSCVAPIYKGDFLEGVTGLDVTIDKFVENILNLDFPRQASAFLADEHGMILAMRPEIETLLGLTELKNHVYKGALQQETLKPEEYNLRNIRDPVIAAQFKSALEKNLDMFDLEVGSRQLLLTEHRIPETAWSFFIVVDKAILFQNVYKLKELSNEIGYAAIGVLLLFSVFFFLYLSRKSTRVSEKIALPIMRLAEGTSGFEASQSRADLPMAGIEEIDQLSRNFQQAAGELEAYTCKLRETNLELEQELAERSRAEQELVRHRERLVELVEERMVELKAANRILQQEIEERKQAEEENRNLDAQLRHAQKIEAIGILAGGIAHDFNNMLVPIMGFAELIRMHLPERDDMKEYAGHLLQAASRAKDLVRRILTFSGQREGERKPVDLGEIIGDVLSLLHSILPATIRIRTEVDPSAHWILADPTQIHQVLMNLCVNAAQAMPDGGELNISLRKAGREDLLAAGGQAPAAEPGVHLCVRDTGIGMDEETLSHVFEPYFTTKGIGKGTGLGLSVVHGIIYQHEGHIRVETEPGRGSSFHIYLPASIPVVKTTVPESERPAGGSETILIVDDEISVLQLLRHTLEIVGYKVIPAGDPVQARELFQEMSNEIDLVITDQTMPFMTGEMLALELLSIRPDIPIILCSGFSRSVSPEEAKKKGVSQFIMKPVVGADLHRAVRQVLDRSRRLGEAERPTTSGLHASP